MRLRMLIITLSLLASILRAEAQIEVRGFVIDSVSGTAIPGVSIIPNKNWSKKVVSDLSGEFKIILAQRADLELISLKQGYRTITTTHPKQRIGEVITIQLTLLNISLPVFEFSDDGDKATTTTMRPVEGVGIYRGMKSEVIRIENVTANLATNNSRQVYAQVPGLNIWENDGAGIQLSIGARGLSPNRSSNFNIRQDLHDISADALGYPESYYTPSLLAVQRVELVRGASALQYGTQFGGTLNFKMRRPTGNGYSSIKMHQAASTFGLSDSISSAIASTSSFVSIDHSVGKTGVFAYYQYKQGSGWRTRSNYKVHSAYAVLTHQINDKWDAEITLTHMDYLAEQAGGLTDEQFAANQRQTNRFRNWFEVNWNMASATVKFNPSLKWSVESKTFGLIASRKAVGFLGQTQREDPLSNRNVIAGDFANIGNESRVLLRSKHKDMPFITTAGFRLYRGTSDAQQGYGDTGNEADFGIDPNYQGESSDYYFPNSNLALFTQSIFPISEHLSLTPGIRYEYISTASEGTYRVIIPDGAGNILEDTTLFNKQKRTRDFILAGIGLSYKKKGFEIYANAVQNYRAINFSDIQIRNTSLLIDPNIGDERGGNVDAGIRGALAGGFRFDVSVFMLFYNDRIGEYFKRDELNRAVRYRTNIADARSFGLEFLVEDDIIRHLIGARTSEFKVKPFLNISLIDGRYTKSSNTAFEDKRLELVPDYILRCGMNIEWKKLRASGQFSAVGEQFTDATNVGSNPNFPYTVNAVDGLVEAYQVVDLSFAYSLGNWKLSANVNNAANSAYFTRRASGYPGPGIIPSDGRSIHLGIEYQWRK